MNPYEMNITNEVSILLSQPLVLSGSRRSPGSPGSPGSPLEVLEVHKFESEERTSSSTIPWYINCSHVA